MVAHQLDQPPRIQVQAHEKQQKYDAYMADFNNQSRVVHGVQYMRTQ